MPSTITSRLQGLTTSVAVKPACKAYTTVNITLSGLPVIGGIALAAGDRVLVRAQSNAVENGIYIAGTGEWSRAADFDGSLDAVCGTIVIVGNVAGIGMWRVSSPDPITFGTSPINFAAIGIGLSSAANDTTIGFYVDDYCTVNTAAGNTAGLQALSFAVNAMGGGVIVFTPAKEYIVGGQEDHASAPTNADGTGSGLYRYSPETLLKITDCDGVIIRLNGAKLQIAAGLRHGAFNADGTAMASPNGYTGVGIAAAYTSIIHLTNCTNILIENGELDGNSANLNKGGPWGDTGYQIGGNGIGLNECSQYEIRNIYSHGHPADGLQIGKTVAGANALPDQAIVGNFRGIMNGRQGLSLVGGKGITFEECLFGFSGRANTTDTTAHAFQSAPGSAADLEAELGHIDDTTFNQCRFICNYGASFLFVGGANIINRTTFHGCTFVGDTNWSFWGQDGYATKVHDSLFVGRLVNLRPHADPDLATQFHDCRFTDDEDLSPTGAVYNEGPICDQGGLGGQNILYQNCRFKLLGEDCTGPFTAGATIFKDVVMDIASETTTFPQGAVFHGINRLTSAGSFDFGGGYPITFGELFVNGANANIDSEVMDFGTIATGASAVVFFPGSIGYSSDEDTMKVAHMTSMPGGCSLAVERHVDGYVNIRLTNHNVGDVTANDKTVTVKRVFIPLAP